MTHTRLILRPLSVLLLALLPAFALAAEIDRFVGTYSGEAEFTYKGQSEQRDMSVSIQQKDTGFNVRWTSVTHKSDGRDKEKTYTIDFAPSERAHIYGSTMETNVFGKAIPLNPLEGEPYVWARIEEDTFSVYSLFINEAGAYEMQEYHRTLADGGLDLVFLRIGPGLPEKEIRAFLERVD